MKASKRSDGWDQRHMNEGLNEAKLTAERV